MRALIVEDEPKIAQSLKKGLEAETFSVDVVEDGDSALSYGRSPEYDVIILDWMLPGSMDGQAACRALRQEGVTTPILMLTARDSTESKVEGLNSGADDYLAKPFSFDELLARLYALLRRPRNLLGQTLTAGKLSLDSSSKSVLYDDEVIDLTAKEFALMEYLMRRAGSVVSKEELINHIWSDDDDVLPNTVEVYIGYLRNKIDRPYNDDILQTKRGFGYMIKQ
ncbi:MAG: response regulator transcription factor [bacterium]|nr:response regulator transcription factor [bacterium]